MNVHCNLVPQTSPFELVAEPFCAEWLSWFVDAAVSAIDRELDDVSDVIMKSMLHLNLEGRMLYMCQSRAVTLRHVKIFAIDLPIHTRGRLLL